MAKTGSFKELVRPRKNDKKLPKRFFGRHRCDAERGCRTGKTILHDYIKATVGFEKLRKRPDPAQESIRMSAAR